MRSRAINVLALLMFVCVFAAFCPDRALAADVPYSIDHVRIDAQVQTDGAMRVVEHHVLEFSSDGSEYKQLLPTLAKNSSVVINDMRVASVDDLDNVSGEWIRLRPVAFQRDWRSSVSTEALASLTAEGSYAYDSARYSFYLFFNASAQSRYVVELDYSIINGAQAYADVADVTFKYINEESDTSSSDVVFSISLPTPEDSAATPGVDVCAWGHGPKSGTVSNLGNTCIFTVDKVNRGQYAEAHILFPVSWLTHLTGADSRIHKDEMHLAWTVNSEKNWEDSFRHAAINDDRVNIALSLAALLLLVVSVAVFMRYRREPIANESAHTVEAAQATLRELEPALAIRLQNGGVPSDREFVSAVLRLCDDGFLKLEEAASGNRVARSSFRFADDPLSKNVLEILDTLDASQTGVSMESLKDSLPRNGEEFVAAVKEWRSTSDALWDEAQFEDLKAAAWARRLRVLAGVFFFVGALTLALTTCYAGGILLMASCVGVFSIAQATSRSTQKAVDYAASLEYARDLLDAGDTSVFGEDARRPYAVALRAYELGASSSDFAEEIEQAIPVAFKLSQKPASTVLTRVRNRALDISKKMRATCKKKNG